MVYQEQPLKMRTAMGWASLGLGLTLFLWAYFWLYRSYPWIGGQGYSASLTLENALTCLQPWAYFECRDTFLGFAAVSEQRFNQLFSVTFSPAFIGLGVIGYSIWAWSFDQTRKRVVAGYPVVPVSEVIETLAEERKGGDEGVAWLPDLPLSRNREKLGVLVTGAPGQGKTLALWPLVLGAHARRDRLVIIDTKGDFTAGVPDDEVGGTKRPPILLAPHDERSAVWDVAEDILLPEDAIELANLLIPDVKGQNEYFPQAARAILVVSILRLIAIRPGKWSWAELVELSRRPLEELYADAEVLYPEAKPFLSSAGTEVSAGTTGSVTSAMQNLRILASVWDDAAMANPAIEKFSLKRFLTDVETYHGRTVILQRSGRFSSLTDRWMTAFLTMAGTLVGTPELQENDQSPVWFIVDEFGEMPKVDKFQKLVNQGRSKGVRVVVAAQDPAQIKDVYGGNILETYQTMFATRVIGQMNPGEPATKVSKDLGEVVERWRVKVPNGNGGYRFEDKESKLPAVHPGDLTNSIGVDRKRRVCWVYLVGIANGPARVAVPFFKPTEYREPTIAAEWTKKPFSVGDEEMEWLRSTDKIRKADKSAAQSSASVEGEQSAMQVKAEETDSVPVAPLLGKLKPIQRPQGYVASADDAEDEVQPPKADDPIEPPVANVGPHSNCDASHGADSTNDDGSKPVIKFGPKLLGD